MCMQWFMWFAYKLIWASFLPLRKYAYTKHLFGNPNVSAMRYENAMWKFQVTNHSKICDTLSVFTKTLFKLQQQMVSECIIYYWNRSVCSQFQWWSPIGGGGGGAISIVYNTQKVWINIHTQVTRSTFHATNPCVFIWLFSKTITQI